MRFLVLAFPDGNISDEIAPELAGIAEADGETGGEVDGLIGPDDLDLVGSELEPGAAAAVLLVEDLWAAPLAGALDRSGGVLLAGARVPGDLLLAEITELG
jgi:hypothetical protein